MNCKIIYLDTRSGYRSRLHSDTLWGAICWAIRMIYSTQKLEDFIAAYQPGGNHSDAIYISSAFPYAMYAGERVHFLPRIYKSVPAHEPLDDDIPFQQKKEAFRSLKKFKKRTWMTLHDFEREIGAIKPKELPENHLSTIPSVKSVAVTHNTINRVTGATLELNNGGQLFHIEENYVTIKDKNNQSLDTGLYFLAKGNVELLEAALRFLQHHGIGGDKSIGKGAFQMTCKDFELQEPQDFNAQVTLSLYHPTEAERMNYQQQQSPLMNYKLVERHGFIHNKYNKKIAKNPTLFFTEGSVLPNISGHSSDIFGENREIGKGKSVGHPVWRYGHGFMVKAKIPE